MTRRDRAKLYVWHLLLAIDQFFNALFGGYPDETISSRAAKARMRGRRWGCVLCRFLDWLDPGHCADSIEHDEGDPTPVLGQGQHG